MVIDISDTTRFSLINIFKDLNFIKGAEIGTDKGLYAEMLLKSIPNLKLYCIDPWKAYEDYKDLTRQNIFDINFRITQKRLEKYNADIIRKTSMEAAGDFGDNSIDFVYIDGNHEYEYVLEDIKKWTKKVKPGGIVSGDDYDWYHKRKLRSDVKDAVTLYVGNNLKQLFVLTKDRAKTWFFIK